MLLFTKIIVFLLSRPNFMLDTQEQTSCQSSNVLRNMRTSLVSNKA